jgi:hypothetical protein
VMTDRSQGTEPESNEPVVDNEGWVPLAEAAERTGRADSWLMDRCNDGRLPSRPGPDSRLLVPMATVEALADGRITE